MIKLGIKRDEEMSDNSYWLFQRVEGWKSSEPERAKVLEIKQQESKIREERYWKNKAGGKKTTQKVKIKK